MNEIRGNQGRKQRHQKLCSRCRRGQNPWERCPERDAECYKCQKKGHFCSQCLTKRVATVFEDDLASLTMDSAFLGSVENDHRPVWKTILFLQGRQLEFKLDTGAEVTAIYNEAYQTHFKKYNLHQARFYLDQLTQL